MKKLISSHAQFEIGLPFAYVIEGFIKHTEKKETAQHSYSFFHIHFVHIISKDVKRYS